MTFLSLFYVWRYVYLCMRIYTRIGVRFMRSVCLLRWQLTSWAMSGRYVVYRWWCTQVRCGVCVWMVYLSMTLSNGGIRGTITGWIKFLKGHGFRHQTTISILSSLPSQTVTWFTHFFSFCVGLHCPYLWWQRQARFPNEARCSLQWPYQAAPKERSLVLSTSS